MSPFLFGLCSLLGLKMRTAPAAVWAWRQVNFICVVRVARLRRWHLELKRLLARASSFPSSGCGSANQQCFEYGYNYPAVEQVKEKASTDYCRHTKNNHNPEHSSKLHIPSSSNPINSINPKVNDRYDLPFCTASQESREYRNSAR